MLSVIGRERELEAAAAFLEGEESGLSVLLIGGDPGIGKTTVWSAITSQAQERGYRVLSCRPAQAESSIPFVSLGDLLEPVLDGDPPDGLPPPQRLALEAALVRVEPSESVGRLAVSRATLALLRGLAAAGPLVVAIDDAQWLDAPTIAVLRFAFRRLVAGEVRAVITARSGSDAALEPPAAARLERLPLAPLSLDELGRLIAGNLQGSLTRPRLAELHRVTAGNPYFALEVVRALNARGQPLSPDARLPIPDDIAALLGERIAALSSVAREAVVLCACAPQPTASLLWSAVGSEAGLKELLGAGILERHGDRLRFSHPLLASYVYSQVPHELLRAAHAQLAAIASDPDDRALHLAHATTAPDAAVAEELEAAALRAYRRGAPAAAAEFEDRAWQLTPTESGHERFGRVTRTAEYHLAAGDTTRGRELLEQLLASPLSERECARVLLRLGDVRYVSDDVAAAHALFEQALAQAGDDARLRADAEQSLAFTSMLGGDIPMALAHARSALELGKQLADARIVALATCRVALNEFLSGHGLDREAFEHAIEHEGMLEGVPFEQLPSYTLATLAAMADDFATADRLFERTERMAAEYGDERAVLSVLFARSEFDCRVGDWTQADRRAAAAVERSRQAGLGTILAWSLYAQALVQAHVGQVAAARAAIAEGLAVAQESGGMAQLTQLTSALGFLELSLDDPAEAHARLAPLAGMIVQFGIAEPGVVRFMANEIEALIGIGELDDAERLLSLLDERARTLDRVSMRAAAARAQALLSAARGDFAAARTAITEAFAQHERLDERFELGRTLLAQGTIERRAQRRADARVALNRALETFDELGAALWSERAASELARIPGRASASNGLSETERRVAALAAEGLANKAIAARLYVTVRTVEAHLSKIYAKLGVHSRVELVARMGPAGDAARPQHRQ